MEDSRNSINNQQGDVVNTELPVVEGIILSPTSNVGIRPETESSPSVNTSKDHTKSPGWRAYIVYLAQNFKELMFCFVLITACLTNLAILNIPYTLFGFLLMLTLLNASRSANSLKMVVVWIVMGLVCANLLFKIVMAILHYTHRAEEFVNLNKDLLVSLGVRFVLDSSVYNAVNTFAGDTVILTFLILMLVFKTRDTVEKPFEGISTMKFQFYSNFLLFAIIISILIKTSINISFSSILLSLIVHFGLLLWGFDKSTLYHKAMYFILLVLLIIHILITHILNLYYLNEFYDENPTIRWLGILKMNIEPLYVMDFLLSGLVCILCIFSIKLNQSFHPRGKVPNKRITSTTRKRYWVRIRDFIVSYIFSPYFSLHLCRLAIIFWIYTFRNYPTLALMLWFFYSCLIINSKRMWFITYLLAWPVLLYLYNTLMVYNIPGLIKPNSHDSLYGFEVLENPNIQFLMIQLTIFLISIFSKTLNMNENLSESIYDFQGNSEVLILNGQEKSPRTKISIVDLLVKLIITNIDKITLIFMYLIAIQRVNISHACKYIILTT
jgi:hypothetical protein